MTIQEIIERLEAIGAALRSEVEEAEDSRLFTGRFVGCIETVLALLADLKAMEVMAEEEATLQREPVTGMYNILCRLPKDHAPCDGHPLRIEGFLELPDEIDVGVTITKRKEVKE